MEQQTRTETTTLLKALYLYNNRAKIIKTRDEEITNRVKDQAWDEKTNPRPLRQDGGVKKQTSDEKKRIEAENEVLRQSGVKV